MSNKRKRLLTVLYITFTISMILVWGQSCINKEDSSATSDIVVEMITPIDELEPGYRSDTGWTYVELSSLVRKLAHVAEYIAVSFQLMCIFLLKGKKKFVNYINCLFLGMLIALIDETIQLFSNRGSEIRDIWIDLLGVLGGLLIAFLAGVIVRRRSKVEKW
ncbi:MAG: VanZ family protein [Lachnospiraceae bacterium]|nr:VanZ family protein [Lachnospiraceae bacterium]